MNSPRFRNVLAALAGYVTLFALLFVSFSAVWWILGADGSFQAGSWEVSGAWILASIVLGLLVAIVGGMVCAKLQANRHGVHVLIGIIVGMTLVSALGAGDAVATGPRPADVSMMDAMSSAQQPSWIVWLNPFLGIFGVILGARLASRAAREA